MFKSVTAGTDNPVCYINTQQPMAIWQYELDSAAWVHAFGKSAVIADPKGELPISMLETMEPSGEAFVCVCVLVLILVIL
jgi:hypothetical protein